MTALDLSVATSSIVTNTHPTYSKRLDQWTKCRDVIIEGEDAVKKKGVKYLPKLKGQSEADYDNYKLRALFFAIGSRSLSALVGMAIQKIPKTTQPKSLEYFTNSNLFFELYTEVLSEVLLQNRAGIFIDWPTDGGNPYSVVYKAEEIINWRYDDSGNLKLVVLKEIYDYDVNDYVTESRIRYRELRIDEGVYSITVHEGANLTSSITYTPQILGKNLNFIPFIGVSGRTLALVDTPPIMLDLANINLSHYLSSADLEHGRHFTGLPTPIITGADADKALYIGSTQFIVLPNEKANAKYLEFTGQGLNSLEKAMDEKLSMMSSLSARLIDNTSRGSEATEAVKLRYLSETSSLASTVKTIVLALTKVLQIFAISLREDENSVSIEADTGFLDTQLTHQELKALFDGYLDGAITVQTLIYNMRKGQRLDPKQTDEEIIKSLEDSAAKAASTKANLA